MKILLIGSNGQLGQCLSAELSDFKLHKADRSKLDLLEKEEKIEEFLEKINPDLIINSSAYTKVDNAEDEREEAYKINADALKTISKFASKKNIYLIHYSTDYVFDGKKDSPYFEDDKTSPINFYGQTKLKGEEFIKENLSKFYIFRTTWVIGRKGNNFAKTIINLAKQKEELKIVKDQIGVPTSTNLISSISRLCILSLKRNKPWPSGIYNTVPNGKTSWFEIAKFLLQLAESLKIKLKTPSHKVIPIESSAFPTKAKRPLNSQLDNSKLNDMLPYVLPEWREDFQKISLEIFDEMDLLNS